MTLIWAIIGVRVQPLIVLPLLIFPPMILSIISIKLVYDLNDVSSDQLS